MKFRSTWLTSVLALCGVLSIGADRACAQFVNGDFESGSFSGWGQVTPIQASVTQTPGAPFNYANGTFNALLQAGTATVTDIANQLTAGNSLGYTITTAQLNAITSPQAVGDGAVIFQQFSGVGPVTFIWGFANSEGIGGGFHDSVFAFLDGSFFDLRDANADATDTAYQTFTSASLPAGNHFLAIGVVNASDDLVDSAMIADNFSIAAVGVPEPTTWAMLGGLSVVAGLYRPISRRIKKRFTGR